MLAGLGPFIQDDISAPAPFTAEAVTFDGSNDYTSANSVTHLSNTRQLTFSAWFLTNTASANMIYVVGADEQATNSLIKISLQFAPSIRITGETFNTENGIFDFRTSEFVDTTGTVWHHILCSFDLTDTNKRHVYADDTLDMSVFTYNNQDIELNNAAFERIGNRNTSAPILWDGDLAEVWVDIDTYIDFSVTANRRKFIDAAGKPVDLGTDGSTPTGTAPMTYMKGNASVWNAGTNSGSGPNWTMTGSVTDSSNEPVEL